jgi:hypothetical protein
VTQLKTRTVVTKTSPTPREKADAVQARPPESRPVETRPAEDRTAEAGAPETQSQSKEPDESGRAIEAKPLPEPPVRLEPLRVAGGGPAQSTTPKSDVAAPVRKRGVAVPIAALLACIAFAAGAGLTVALHGSPFRAVDGGGAPEPSGGDVKLSSPYEMLSSLPKISPRGQPVNVDEQQQFLGRGLSMRAKDPEESEFWLKWAARSTLGQAPTSQVLSALGVIVVRGHETAGSVAAGRLIWAMAALSGDCNALRNLATSHVGPDGKAIDEAAAAEWRDRARQAGCPANK